VNTEVSHLERLIELKRLRELESTPFPLTSLLVLYTKSYNSLYLNYFEGFQELITWLSPISPSTYPIIHVPRYLLNYEMQELAKHTGNHISQIYQELTHHD